MNSPLEAPEVRRRGLGGQAVHRSEASGRPRPGSPDPRQARRVEG